MYDSPLRRAISIRLAVFTASPPESWVFIVADDKRPLQTLIHPTFIGIEIASTEGVVEHSRAARAARSA